jgi:Flp pilus assembly protein TadD
LDQGKLDVAEREYRAAAEQDPQSAAARFGLGNVLVRAGKIPEAEAAFLAALKLDPNQAAAHANLGVVYYQQENMAKAAASFQEALRINEQDAPTLYLLAAVRLQENDLQDAETLLNKAKALDPALPEVYYGLGVLYRLRGRNADAIAAFEKFLEIGPGQDASATDYARRELEALRAD